MHTTWLTDDPGHVLSLLEQRLEGAEDLIAVERSVGTLVVRSRGVSTRAYLLSAVLPPFHMKSRPPRARKEMELRITVADEGQERVLHLDGDANAAVSSVLVATSHELFPDKVADWDDE